MTNCGFTQGYVPWSHNTRTRNIVKIKEQNIMC